MSLRPQAVESIPEDTFRVAHAAFPKGDNPILALRDHLSQLFSDEDFIGLYHRLGQPGYSPWRLILVCIFQFMENLVVAQSNMLSCAYGSNDTCTRMHCLSYHIKLIPRYHESMKSSIGI